MKIKTLAIVVLSALPSVPQRLWPLPRRLMVGPFTLKGKLLTPLAQLMQALLIKPFSWDRFVPLA